MKYVKFALLSAFLLFVFSCSTLSGSAHKGFGDRTPLAQDNAVVSGILENGISWMVLKNSEPANRVYLRLAVKAGSVLEDDDQKGVAHFIEHMAFNGSEHFQKNELIDYFESIGMTFGPEVNAYTSFDETVYMLEIPADNPAVLQKSMMVLKDWAGGLSFDPVELEKERGVVIEEWRLGRGAHGRIQDKQMPFLFNGSRYGERLPIGDPEIVKTVPRQRVVDFYKKWYRPDVMSVMLVGDLDTAVMASAVQNSLGAIPAAASKQKPPVFPLPVQEKPAALVIRDPEISYTTIQIMQQNPSSGRTTTGDLKKRIAQNMALSIFNNRLNEKTLLAHPLMLDAKAGVQRLTKPTRFTSLGMVPSEGNFVPAFKQLLEEMMRLEQFGVTDAELAREKQSVLDSMRQTWLDRDKVNSAGRASEMVQYVLYDDTMISIQNRFDLYNALVPEINLADINVVIAEWLTGRGKQLVVTASDAAADIPDNATLLDLWQNWKPETPVVPYTEGNLDRPLFEAAPAGPAKTAGTIVKEEILSRNGIQQWTLSNGAKVVLYPTAYKANEILFSAYSKGGSSLVTDADYPSASIAASFQQMSGLNGFSSVELQKKLAGKTVSVESWIDDSYEGLTGASSIADLETLFQLINLGFTKPEFSDDAYQSLISQYETVTTTRKNKPEEVFSDMTNKLMYGSSIRHSNLTDAYVAAINRGVAEKTYRARFADAGDFTFVFVGSFDETKMRSYAETYLAALPGNGPKEEARDVAVPFPTGIKTDVLKMGIDPKSTVFFSFGGKAKIEGWDYELFDAMCSLLDIRFREVVREDMSGSYGIDVHGLLVGYPAPVYELTIEFGCEPGREEVLSAAVLDQIRALQKTPVTDVYITKLRESIRRSHEEGLKNNGYWMHQIVGKMVRGRPLDEISDTDSIVSRITPAVMQEFILKYLNTGNYVKAVLMPKDSGN